VTVLRHCSKYDKTSSPIPPAFGHITPDFILAETVSVLAASRRLRDELANSLTPTTATFASVLVPPIDDENAANCRLKPLVLLASVSPISEVRDAARKAEKLIAQASTENLVRQDIAALIRGVVDKGEELEPEDMHLLTRKSQECVYVSPADSTWYLSASTELSELLSLSRKTLSDGNEDGIAFSRDLDGLPASVLATMRATDENGGDGGDNVWVTFRKSHYAAVMRHASSVEMRKRLYVAKQQRFPESVESCRESLCCEARLHTCRDLLATPF